jgi:uncharacterized membrane protein
MSERLTSTTQGDAPLTAAREPDARATALGYAQEGDELIGRTMTIARPLEELYAFLRDPARLPLVFGADGVSLSGVLIEEDEPGRVVTFRTAPQVDRRLSGRVEFRPAPAGRGTEVTVTLAQEPRGVIGKVVDKLTQDHDPRIQARRALRRFKQLMETGEIATAAAGPAAPRGD